MWITNSRTAFIARKIASSQWNLAASGLGLSWPSLSTASLLQSLPCPLHYVSALGAGKNKTYFPPPQCELHKSSCLFVLVLLPRPRSCSLLDSPLLLLPLWNVPHKHSRLHLPELWSLLPEFRTLPGCGHILFPGYKLRHFQHEPPTIHCLRDYSPVS